MAGYALDRIENTTLVGNSFDFNAIDKAPTPVGFLDITLAPEPLPAIVYPGGEYVNDPTGSAPGAYVQGNTFYGGSSFTSGSNSLAFPGSVTAGDLIVIAFGYGGGANNWFLSASDTLGTVFHHIDLSVPSISYEMHVIYGVATASGADTVTINTSQGLQFCRFLIQEYSGYGGIDVSGTNLHGAVATNAITLTTTASNDFIFGWCVDNNGVSSYNPPEAIRLTAGSESTGDNAGASNSSGSNTITCNVLSGGGGMIAASFLATGGGGPPVDVGSVSMSGSAGMTVGAMVTEIAAVTMAASASQTVSGIVTEQATVSMAATAGMNVSGIDVGTVGVSLVASAGMTVGGVVTEIAAVSLSGTASLAVNAAVTEVAQVSMSGTASLTVSSKVTEIATVTMSGASSLTVGVSVTEIAAVSMSATAGLTATGIAGGANSVGLAATTSLTVTAFVVKFASVTMSGSASLNVGGYGVHLGAVAMTASGALTIAGYVVETAAVTMTATAGLIVRAQTAVTGGQVAYVSRMELEAVTVATMVIGSVNHASMELESVAAADLEITRATV